jgi:hypothetical protein
LPDDPACLPGRCHCRFAYSRRIARGKYRVMRRYPIENLCSAYVYEQIVFRDLMR